MGSYIGPRDGSVTDEQGWQQQAYRLFTSGVSTIHSSTSLAVTQRGAGANMSVDVAAGDAHLILPSGLYSYWGWTDATTNATVTASNPSNPRIDTIVAYVDLSVIDAVNPNSPGAFKFAVVAGTPAGSPSAPSGGTIQSALGAGVPYVVLADIAVAASATTIVNANITDRRQTVAFKGKLWGGTSNTNGHSVPNVADDTVTLNAATQTLTNKTINGSQLVDSSVTNAKLSTSTAEIGAALGSWTPTWTNLTVGNGTQTAVYVVHGKLVFLRLSLVFGSTTSLTGSLPTFSLPVPSKSYPGSATRQSIGQGMLYDSGTANYNATVLWDSTTTATLRTQNAASTYVKLDSVNSTTPFSWGTGDEIYCEAIYEKA